MDALATRLMTVLSVNPTAPLTCNVMVMFKVWKATVEGTLENVHWRDNGETYAAERCDVCV